MISEIVIGGRSFRVVDDASKLIGAAALQEAGRVSEAEFLYRSIGQDAAGRVCERQPARIVNGIVVPWPSIRLVTAVHQEKGKVVNVVTEFDGISSVRWSEMSDAQRVLAEKLVAEIHAADIEVAQAPECVRNQFWQTLPDGINPSDYAQVVRDWLEAARRDVAELGLA
ncbi:MAG: hypothetical protein K8U57_38320 [Planctomycetes bacterium]|nr:hypothetical protein [Planctomycetota bacterium]